MLHRRRLGLPADDGEKQHGISEMVGEVAQFPNLKVVIQSWGTLPETNIAPENRSFQKETKYSNQPFSGAKMLLSGRVTVFFLFGMGSG